MSAVSLGNSSRWLSEHHKELWPRAGRGDQECDGHSRTDRATSGQEPRSWGSAAGSVPLGLALLLKVQHSDRQAEHVKVVPGDEVPQSRGRSQS